MLYRDIILNISYICALKYNKEEKNGNYNLVTFITYLENKKSVIFVKRLKSIVTKNLYFLIDINKMLLAIWRNNFVLFYCLTCSAPVVGPGRSAGRLSSPQWGSWSALGLGGCRGLASLEWGGIHMHYSVKCQCSLFHGGWQNIVVIEH